MPHTMTTNGIRLLAFCTPRYVIQTGGRISDHFSSSPLRVEIVLSGFGFTGGNSIACTNLCRDEVTSVLKDKIEAAFGSSFNTNGLGGVLTCGVTGMGAGLSHSPKCDVSGSLD